VASDSGSSKGGQRRQRAAMPEQARRHRGHPPCVPRGRCDIVETNTFGATAISQSDYGLSEVAWDINVAAARIARRAADAWSEKTPNQPRFVAGTIGPTARHSRSRRRSRPGIPQRRLR